MNEFPHLSLGLNTLEGLGDDRGLAQGLLSSLPTMAPGLVHRAG